MTDDPAFIIAAPGSTPARISKPSVGRDDEIVIVYPDPSSAMEPATDRVPRREVCARLDGFAEVELLRTERRIRLMTILNADMLHQWLETRDCGLDGQIDDPDPGSPF